MSYTEFAVDELGTLGKLIVRVLQVFRLAHFQKVAEGKNLKMNNLTLINFVLYVGGPRHERTLTQILLAIQVWYF